MRRVVRNPSYLTCEREREREREREKAEKEKAEKGTGGRESGRERRETAVERLHTHRETFWVDDRLA
jgi:hypothetical protein